MGGPLFLAISAVQLSPEAELKSDKGLKGPERKEISHYGIQLNSSLSPLANLRRPPPPRPATQF